MDKAAILKIRLANQMLLQTNCKTPKEVVLYMGAMQAQDFNMAKWAIGIRTQGGSHRKVQEAFDKGEILRTHVMRPTWHFVASDDIRWLLPLTADKIKGSMKSRDKELGLTPTIYNQAKDVFQKALQGGKHLNKKQLTLELEKAKITVNSSTLYHMLMYAEVNGIVCSGALQGKEQTYALLEERVPEKISFTKEEALARLARKYFASHAPATLQDFVWWSGLSVTEAKQGIHLIGSELIAEKCEADTYFLHNSFLQHTDTVLNKSTIHLLPAYDEFLISYKNRTAAIVFENQAKAISSNGIFRPTIAQNGAIVGIWKKGTTKKQAVVFDFFDANKLSNQDLTQATQLFLDFLEN